MNLFCYSKTLRRALESVAPSPPPAFDCLLFPLALVLSNDGLGLLCWFVAVSFLFSSTRGTGLESEFFPQPTKKIFNRQMPINNFFISQPSAAEWLRSLNYFLSFSRSDCVLPDFEIRKDFIDSRSFNLDLQDANPLDFSSNSD